jgi:DNA-binding transcriptional ArsR family regulator
MTKIVLDAEAFKALASDTRLHILKALDARPLTVSELSRLLELNKATVFEHLKQLMAADLAKREDDPARKWVYYRLTWKGKNVLHPENAQIFLMLGLAALGLGGAVLQTAYLAQLWIAQKGILSTSQADLAGGDESQNLRQIESDGDAASPEPHSASSSTTDQPAAAGAPASSSASSGAADKASGSGGQDNVGEADVLPIAPDDSAASTEGPAWWEPLTSNYFLTLLGVLVFLGLLTLIIWTLYGGQRKERAEIRRRLGTLPADVNASEPTIGSAA